jgi:hypothetical protein
MTIDVVALPASEQGVDPWAEGPDRYDYSRLPDELRHQAMLAQGTIVEGLSSAVRRVLDAGKALAWAKSELPHGEYLPWVQQACGLKPRYAQRLIQSADFVNAAHAPYLDSVTDVTTLFLLSADTTTEDVREWFMERCAAGDVPSRAEVAERKRSAGQPRPPQPAEAVALAILRKGEIERIREALALAERSVAVTADQVMAELRLRELPKGVRILGADADFHRLKDGSWVRMPHAGRVDIEPEPQAEPEPQSQAPSNPLPPKPVEVFGAMDTGLMSLERAAVVMGISRSSLTAILCPARYQQRGGPYIRNGISAVREGRGMVRVTRVDP